MSKEQKDQMHRLLGGFCEKITKIMGKNVETVPTINTGEHQPITQTKEHRRGRPNYKTSSLTW